MDHKLVTEFGAKPIDQSILDRFEKLTGHKPHRYLRRSIFMTHRDLDWILDNYERSKPFYLYTGRGPSSASMHLGHLIPFEFTKWLQDVFDVPLVIQLTPDEKFLYQDHQLEDTLKYTESNIKDIIAVGFNPEKTFIFTNLSYIHQLYPLSLKLSNNINFNQLKAIFGLNESDSIGKFYNPILQAVPSSSEVFEQMFSNRLCLVICATDQDPYFRMTRDLATKLKLPKPALIHSTFLPSLLGQKMSSSIPNSTIFLSDNLKEIKKKVNRAVSGGHVSLEEQRRLGADLSVDVPFRYLEFFLEDDQELEQIRQNYGSEPNNNSKMLTGEVKKITENILRNICQKHQNSLDQVSPELVDRFMAIKKMD